MCENSVIETDVAVEENQDAKWMRWQITHVPTATNIGVVELDFNRIEEFVQTDPDKPNQGTLLGVTKGHNFTIIPLESLELSVLTRVHESYKNLVGSPADRFGTYIHRMDLFIEAAKLMFDEHELYQINSHEDLEQLVNPKSIEDEITVKTVKRTVIGDMIRKEIEKTKASGQPMVEDHFDETEED